MMNISFVTTSNKKFREVAFALRSCCDLVQCNIHLVEIQGTPDEILENKIFQASSLVTGCVLVDDVSFGIDMLGGFPGPYMKDMAQAMTASKMAELFVGSGATAFCRLALHRPDQSIIKVIGEVSGDIVFSEVSAGYGFEPFFQPHGADKTLGEMSVEEKNMYSHRGNALKKLIFELDNLQEPL